MKLLTPARIAALVLGLLVMGPAVAQPRTAAAAVAVAPFRGTLQKICETGVIRVVHRENSPPFAFLDAKSRPCADEPASGTCFPASGALVRLTHWAS